MGLDTKHPEFMLLQEDWEQLQHTFEGQRTVKREGQRYLPATSGMQQDGMTTVESLGYRAYVAYRTRAHFPEIVSDAVEAMLGVMHQKPSVFELPDALQDMEQQASLLGESLETVLMRINERQLLFGRVGALLDMPQKSPRAAPYIALYDALRMTNWDEGTRQDPTLRNLNLVVLDERGPERNSELQWRDVEKYRVLVLGDVTANEGVADGAIYRQGLMRETKTLDTSQLTEPKIQGRTATEIPFVFINARDLEPQPDRPPLLGLSNLALAIYRGDADYRQALFMQGQDTLVILGSTEDEGETRTGAGATISLPSNGDAKYIGTESSGIPEMRSALENDYTRAGKLAGEMMDDTSRERESGEALKVRVAARTATLTRIAKTGAAGLETLLKIAGRWMNVPDSEVDKIKVEPNLDFVPDDLEGGTLVDWVAAKVGGFPVSWQSLHERAQERGLTDLPFEDEVKRMEAEQSLEVLNGPDDDPDDPETGDPPADD